MSERRKIGVVTGSRAEYGYLKPLLKRINDTPNLDLLLYVTGAHLLKEYGESIKEIKKEKFKNLKIINMKMKKDNTHYDIAVSISEGIKNFAKTFQEERPEILVVFGDRIEAFSAAVAASAMNLIIAHIGGGEVGLGDIDDNLRHAITKLAHLHFVSTALSKKRVLNLGEEEWRVFHVGTLTLDIIFGEKLLSKKELSKLYFFSSEPIMLVCFHPLTTETEEAMNQFRELMGAVEKVINEKNMQLVIIYPNPYPGSYQILEDIRRRRNKRVFVFDNIPHLHFLSLMACSKVFVGNSSSGIIEAPSLGLPYVCVGKRQKGRECADNVIFVEDFEKEKIKKAIKKALLDKKFLQKVKKRETPYGDGRTSERIVKVLSTIKIDKRLLQKRITY
jgi:GDP/UDP-N,N'-diacetylbacillosamine 2-epimerase (hydrolysing)